MIKLLAEVLTEAVARHAKELARHDTSKGTVRFPAEKPLPATLVRKLVKTRIATR